jgi:dimethylargininase
MLGDRYSETYNYFTHAITRKPGENFADGITSGERGRADFRKALDQHAAYVATLRGLGVTVRTLEPDERYADGCFVEDAAIVTESGAILTNPGDLRRQGEYHAILSVIQEIKGINETKAIAPPGTLDGGDVLRIRDHFFIGVSKRSKRDTKLTARTNEDGAWQLRGELQYQGFIASIIDVDSVLHLKTGITCAGQNAVVGLPEFTNHAAFRDYDKIVVPTDEQHAANVLLVNGTLLMHAGNPKTEAALRSRGFDVKAIEMSEFEKQDGGVTCLAILLQGKERLKTNRLGERP